MERQGDRRAEGADRIYVEGRLQTRKWQDKDGNDRYTTEVVANEMQMLSGRGGGGGGSSDYSQGGGSGGAPGPGRSQGGGQSSPPPADDLDDDIPFCQAVLRKARPARAFFVSGRAADR